MRRTAIALSCGVLALAGCSTGGSGQSVVLDAGQAAVSSEFRIAQSEVAEDVSLVLTGLGQPTGEPPAGLASTVTRQVVLNRLIESYAAEIGVEATRTEVEQGRAQLAEQNGGEESLRQSALQAGIPPERLDDAVRRILLVTAIGQQLNAAGDPNAQAQSAEAALSEYSEAIGVEVSPRYGTWDDTRLEIVPGSSVSEPSAQEQAS